MAYFALYDAARGQGITKKINGFLSAAASEGWVTGSVVLHEKGLRGHLALGCAIARAPQDVLIVRSTAHHLAALVPFCIFARFRRTVILDVPTPHAAALHELLRSRAPWVTRLLKAAFLIVSGPFVFWPFHSVIQYAGEGAWWMTGNRRRVRGLGNGIYLPDVPVRAGSPPWPDRSLRLIPTPNNGGEGYPMREESQQLLLDFLRVPAESRRRQREGVYESHTYGPEGQRVKGDPAGRAVPSRCPGDRRRDRGGRSSGGGSNRS